MNRALDIMWEHVHRVMADSKFVTIDEYELDDVAEDIKQWWASLSSTNNLRTGLLNMPRGTKNDRDVFMYYLMADAVNFCYWHGKGTWRPGKANSGKMEDLLSTVFEKANETDIIPSSCRKREWVDYRKLIQSFIDVLIYERFPMLRERIERLKELDVCIPVILHGRIFPSFDVPDIPLDTCLDQLLMDVPGYAEDVFLKRASLFFLDLWRRRGHLVLSTKWEEALKDFPAPIDYHIPNVLRHLECIRYRGRLKKMIDRGDLIPKGSRMEVEIRATAAYACRYLVQKTNLGPAEIDVWLFQQRAEAQRYSNFHLTITTDY